MVTAGDGRDLLIDTDSGTGEIDRYDGGAGADHLIHRAGGNWSVDLSAGTASNAGEADSVAGLERVTGGPGRDMLVGTDSAEVLTGRGGRDRLFGGAGHDTLVPGRTRTFRGQETTVWSWSDRAGDEVDCGEGADYAGTPEYLDAVTGCEPLATGLAQAVLRPDPVTPTGPRSVSADVTLLPSARTRLAILVDSPEGPILLGRRTVSEAGPATVRLNRAGRRLLRDHHDPLIILEASRAVLDDGGRVVARQRLSFLTPVLTRTATARFWNAARHGRAATEHHRDLRQPRRRVP